MQTPFVRQGKVVVVFWISIHPLVEEERVARMFLYVSAGQRGGRGGTHSPIIGRGVVRLFAVSRIIQDVLRIYLSVGTRRAVGQLTLVLVNVVGIEGRIVSQCICREREQAKDGERGGDGPSHRARQEHLGRGVATDVS